MKQLLINIEMLYPSCDKYDPKDVGEFVQDNVQDWLNANLSDGDDRMIWDRIDVIGEGSFIRFANTESRQHVIDRNVPKDIKKSAAKMCCDTLAQAVQAFLLDYDELLMGKDGTVSGIRDGKEYKIVVNYQISEEEV